MSILLLKTLHIVGFTAWFAGLFYLVRIFVYHTEAFDKPLEAQKILRAQYEVMEQRVYKIICNPAMMITWAAGIAMIVKYGYEWFADNRWLHIKLVLLVGLTIYHLSCKRLIARIKTGPTGWSSFGYRLYNEVPTLLLVSIATLAVYRDGVNLLTAAGSIIGLGAALFVITKAYKRLREKTNV
jgi:putative membrane protein